MAKCTEHIQCEREDIGNVLVKFIDEESQLAQPYWGACDNNKTLTLTQ